MSGDKERQIVKWIKELRGSNDDVNVCDYCYDCVLSGIAKRKTLLVVVDQLTNKGIITVPKPMEEVTQIDLINLYRVLK